MMQILAGLPVAAGLSLTPLRAAGGGFRYALTLAIGTPEQRLALVFDTGSHLLLLRDAALGACAPSEPRAGGPCFNSTRSTSLWSPPSERVSFSFSYIVDVNVRLHGSYVAVSDLAGLAVGPFNETGSSRAGAATRHRVDAALLPAASGGGLAPPESLPFFWADAAGVLGTSPAATATQGAAWQQLIAPYDETFALDLNRDQASSTLLLGEEYRQRTKVPQWSEAQPSTFHQLSVFDLSLCGASLLGTISGWWVAIVDTGSSCLGLPSDVFEHMFNWLPAECNFARPGAAVSSTDEPRSLGLRTCWLPGNVSEGALPMLVFRLTQDAPLLQLPLEELLLPPAASGKREYCIRSQEMPAAGHLPTEVPLLFGSAVLEPFISIFEMSPWRRRVGLSPEGQGPSVDQQMTRRATCVPRAECIGQQRYIAAANMCEEPDCSARYFQRFDSQTHRCVTSRWFLTLAVLILSCFAGAEILMREWFLDLSARGRGQLLTRSNP